MKVKKQIAAPMTREEFDQSWNDLLRVFLVLGNDEWIESRESFSGPNILQQSEWRVNAVRHA